MSTPANPVAPSLTLASFVAETAWDIIDAAVREHAARVATAALQAAAVGADSAGANSAFGAVGGLGSTPEAGLVGRAERLAAPEAAFVNATAARSGGGNGGEGVVVFAALAAAEAAAVDGAALWRGIALGLEVSRRVEEALGDSHPARGYDTAGTSARVGAAAGVAAVLGLDAGEVHSAFGYAATSAAGLAAAAPAAVAALIAGLAAADSVRAARLAEAGLIGPPEPLEGRRGLFALESAGADVSRLVDGLGSEWASLAGAENAPAISVAGPLFDSVVALDDAASIGELVRTAASLATAER